MTHPSFRTPLGRVRSLGAAHTGAGENWAIRVTSMALVPLSIAFVVLVIVMLHRDYHGARALMGQPFPALITLLFVLAGIYHTEIGMRSVIVDYLHGQLREWSLVANTCAAVILGIACVYAVLRIGFV